MKFQGRFGTESRMSMTHGQHRSQIYKVEKKKKKCSLISTSTYQNSSSEGAKLFTNQNTQKTPNF